MHKENALPALQTDTSFKHLWILAYPAMIGMLAEQVVGVVDTAFLGHLGEVELGASAIASTYYIILYCIGMGFCTGTQILISRRNGEKNYKQIGGIFENGLYAVWGISAVLIVLSFVYSPYLLRHIVASDVIVDATLKFLNIRVFTLFFSLGNTMMRSFFVGILNMRYISIASLIIAGTNGILDYILIFGKLGLPEMGLEGAAIASVLAEMIGFAYLVIVVLLKVDIEKYAMFRFSKPSWNLFKKTFQLSGAVMFQNLFVMSSWFLFFAIIEKTGVDNLAVTNIARSYYALILVPIWAYNMAVGTKVGNAIGANERQLVYRIIWKATQLSVLTSLVIATATALLPKLIMSIYTEDVMLIELGYRSFYVIAIAIVMGALTSGCYAAIPATGNTTVAMIIGIGNMTIYLFYTWLISQWFPTQPAWFWSSEILYYVLTGSISILYLRTGRWANKKI
ncbi:MATE family efflux transporter [Bacteroidia bacterium]|nr:MATE family efflux transporter [Bacteroidia bacterium]